MKMITANATADGRPVYLAPQGAWTRQLAEGETFATGDHMGLELALAAAQRDEASVCGAYVIDVVSGPEGARAGSLREQIRAHGPTVGQGLSAHLNPPTSS